MIQADGWFFPDGETHLVEWLRNPKNRYDLNGRVAYQGKKQVAAMHLCKSFRTAVDVGGHVGLFSFNLAHRFDVVHAFEPIPKHRECFARNVDMPNVHLHAVALGQQAGVVAMHTAATSSGDTWIDLKGKPDTPLKTLDEYELQDVDLIKIDCEGSELFVLHGAIETLKRCKPAVMVEQKPGHAQRYGLGEKDAVPYLESLGAKLRLEISGDFFLSWD